MAQEQVVEAPPAQMISNGVEENKFSPEDNAAYTFDQLVPIWDRFVDNAPKKSLARVVKASMKWPLHDVPKFQKNELEAFKILCTILDCKTIMVSSVLEERLKKESEQKENSNDENLQEKEVE